MDVDTFDELLTLVKPHIAQRNTKFRNAISPGERLAITLRFQATGKCLKFLHYISCEISSNLLMLVLGETYRSLQYLYRLSEVTIGRIVPQMCEILAQ